MKKSLFIAFLTIGMIAYTQTNVSGGIYSNTTWLKANSPYIVTGNMVLFPGLTLTIQPGVVVKFDNNVQIEVRQSRLIALGTNIDSIIFTSNTSQTPGSWNQVILNGGTMTSKFSYCAFSYATIGLYDSRGGSGDTILIRHSTFYQNTTGLDGQGTSYGKIDTSSFKYNASSGVSSIVGGQFSKCDFSHNQTGIDCHQGNQIKNCTINYNQTGVASISGSSIDNCIINYNQIGIDVNSHGVTIKNSSIDSNTVVDTSPKTIVSEICILPIPRNVTIRHS